jgi:hypothetical protein
MEHEVKITVSKDASRCGFIGIPLSPKSNFNLTMDWIDFIPKFLFLYSLKSLKSKDRIMFVNKDNSVTSVINEFRELNPWMNSIMSSYDYNQLTQKFKILFIKSTELRKEIASRVDMIFLTDSFHLNPDNFKLIPPKLVGVRYLMNKPTVIKDTLLKYIQKGGKCDPIRVGSDWFDLKSSVRSHKFSNIKVGIDITGYPVSDPLMEINY